MDYLVVRHLFNRPISHISGVVACVLCFISYLVRMVVYPLQLPAQQAFRGTMDPHSDRHLFVLSPAVHGSLWAV